MATADTRPKRFEKTSDKARKLDTPVRFPAQLNMAPYTSTWMKEGEKENVYEPAGLF